MWLEGHSLRNNETWYCTPAKCNLYIYVWTGRSHHHWLGKGEEIESILRIVNWLRRCGSWHHPPLTQLTERGPECPCTKCRLGQMLALDALMVYAADQVSNIAQQRLKRRVCVSAFP